MTKGKVSSDELYHGSLTGPIAQALHTTHGRVMALYHWPSMTLFSDREEHMEEISYR